MQKASQNTPALTCSEDASHSYAPNKQDTQPESEHVGHLYVAVGVPSADIGRESAGDASHQP